MVSQLTCHRCREWSSPPRWWPPEATGWWHWIWATLCKSKRSRILWEKRKVICFYAFQMVVQRKKNPSLITSLVVMHQQPSQNSAVRADSFSLLPRAQLWDNVSVSLQAMRKPVGLSERQWLHTTFTGRGSRTSQALAQLAQLLTSSRSSLDERMGELEATHFSQLPSAPWDSYHTPLLWRYVCIQALWWCTLQLVLLQP